MFPIHWKITFRKQVEQGRNQLPAEAIIIEEPADFKDAENLYFSALPTEDFIKQVYRHLNQYFKIHTEKDLKENIHLA